MTDPQHHPTMVAIPTYGPATTLPVTADTISDWFTDAHRLGGSITLTRDDHNTQVLLRYGTQPTRHHNSTATQLIARYTGIDQPITGLAVITATSSGDLAPVPEAIGRAARILAAHSELADAGRTPTMRAIGAAATNAEAMLAARPAHPPALDVDAQIEAAITELLAYAAVRYGNRNHTRVGVVIRKAIAAVADDANDNMAAIELPWQRNHNAPGFTQEAAWTIGELLTEAQRRSQHDPQTNRFALLRNAVLDHMANAPFAPQEASSNTIADLGGRLAALTAEATAELGPDGPLDILCWATDHPAEPHQPGADLTRPEKA